MVVARDCGHMLRHTLRSLPRASLIAYGGWVVVALLLLGSTLGSLHQAEQTQVAAGLARAEADAASVGQLLIALADRAGEARDLAQTRQRLLDPGNIRGVTAVEQQMRDVVSAGRYGIRGIAIIRPDGAVEWSAGCIAVPAGDPSVDRFQALDGFASANPASLRIGRPVFTPESRSWTLRLTAPVQGAGGAVAAEAYVLVDAIALSREIRNLSSELGAVSAVQARQDGAFLARSIDPEAALRHRAATDDLAFRAGLAAAGGHLRDEVSGVDRLIGFRAPAGLPFVVTVSVSTNKALADFFRLRRVMLAGVLALIAGGGMATRLILANYLLRKRLGHVALRDPLTGLHNRRYFTTVMARRMAASRKAGLSAAVLLVDLDRFKQVNDAHGHLVGDELLRQAGHRLRSCNGRDGTVIRLGGDEFAVVRFGRQQTRDATSLARYIVEALGQAYPIEGRRHRVSASVGIATDDSRSMSLHDLLRSADIALQCVKTGGGGAYRLFDPEMDRCARAKQALEADLREALGRGELELFFQPLVQLEPRCVSGFEALLRWNHPVLGLVSPGNFIPLAEETGLIVEIGEWVLREACREAVSWPGSQRIAVNLSPVQFERSDIADIVAAALRESGLSADRLELEITEGVVMRDVGDGLRTMLRLRALGVRLALDDFGTGYSSLSYLRPFPFDKVKIDGSFLSDLNGDGGTIVRAVLGLCSHLALDTLVEGVESEDQLQWLRREGCTQVQGHLFSPPRPAKRVPGIISSVSNHVTLTPEMQMAL